MQPFPVLVDHEGEVLLPSPKERQAALKFMKNAMGAGSQTRSSQISLGLLQQQENWDVQKSKLLSDGQTTELRIHIYPFDDGKGTCFGLTNAQSTEVRLNSRLVSHPRRHSQNAVLAMMLLLQSGALLSLIITISRPLMLEPICYTAPR